ncbi:MAG: hypothetical protein KGY65_00865 [Candidatus Thermoplasmatota archaeon]|jgi:hypothetical protein|nr:hypothetical protein [Candidatus Thermoplasmatota archaeon]MBS3801280.1 hypothetical protein [Candidatus Thermoplasmatota archaeon]
MKKKPELELTKGSEYKIYSLSSRNSTMESVGIFKGYTAIGSDEAGFLLQLNHTEENDGIMRIIPLHAVLAIDVIKAEPKDTDKEDTEIPHYVG